MDVVQLSIQEVQRYGQVILELLVVGVLGVIELTILWRVSSTLRVLGGRIADGRRTLAAADAEIKQSPDQVGAMDRITQDSHLSLCWQSLKTLARFPAPDLTPVWRAARAPFEVDLQQLRSAPNQALLWGLLATVASLVWAFWDMGGTLKAGTHGQDPGALADSIAPYLSRFRAAFLSTGLGVLTAIWVASQNAKAHRLVDGYLDNVETFLLNTCAPLAIPPSMEHSLERIQVALETANAQAQETAKYMRGAAVSIARQVASMRETTASAIASYQNISSEIQEGASRLRENVTELGNVQRSVQNGYADLQKTIQEHHERLYDEQAKTLQVFLDTARKVQSLLVSHTNQTLQAFSTAGERFDRACDRFGDASVEFREMSKLIGFEAYNKMEEWSSRFHDALSKQAKDLELIEAHLIEVSSAVRDMMERMNPQLLHTDDWAKMRAVLDNGASAGDLYLQTAEQVQTHLAQQHEQFRKTCQAFLRELRSVARLPQAVAQSSDQLMNGMTSHAEALGATAARMEALGNLLSRLAGVGDSLRPLSATPLIGDESLAIIAEGATRARRSDGTHVGREADGLFDQPTPVPDGDRRSPTSPNVEEGDSHSVLAVPDVSVADAATVSGSQLGDSDA